MTEYREVEERVGPTLEGTEGFKRVLLGIAKKVKAKPTMTEGDIYSCFVDGGFFKNLGYTEPGIDIRAQEDISGRKADYDCVDEVEQSIFILELKKPSESDLLSYRDKQLRDRYVLPKKARYGVLSNGIEFHVFKREGDRLTDELRIDTLESVTNEQAMRIYSLLRKPGYEYTNIAKTIKEVASLEVKSLAEEINRESFYDIFKLAQEETGRPTKFTRLVFSLMELFDELMSGEKSQFLEGAYKFWERSYAHKPSKLPENWKKLEKLMHDYEEKGDGALYNFMFCLETAHNIVAKLILAKVAEDSGFRNTSALDKLSSYMNLEFGDQNVTYNAYPFAVKRAFDTLRNTLVESLFEEDIFDWWEDCSLRVGGNPKEWRNRTSYAVEFFGKALAHIFFSLRSFDFRELKEDILGELYQHYFDPETRKALGEFYTPLEVVNYILDAVDYNGQKILNQRLLDPACGSGTFIVEALQRYLHETEKKIAKMEDPARWAEELRDLCERPKIIGFDINPFARLMAQMRFMMAILPYYRLAKEASNDFVLTTIPIFRTDSLEIETKTGRFQKQLSEYAGDIKFSMRLPVISKEPKEGEEFIPVSFSIPAWEKLRDTLRSKENYFLLLQQCFSVIKNSVRKSHWEIDKAMLKKEFSSLFDEGEVLAGIMLEYVNPILGQIYVLRKQYSDGRLIKTLEDLVLAGVLKNFFLYDYVVGNPPYVRLQMIDENRRREYEEIYQSAMGLYDLYCLFIERGITWLNQNGSFGYIISNKFLARDYGEGLRKFLLENASIFQILDFGDSGVFKDATNYPLILIAKKQNQENILKNVIKCAKVAIRYGKTDQEMIDYLREKITNETFSDSYLTVFKYPQNDLKVVGWELKPIKEERTFNLIREHASFNLKNATKSIQVGIQTGADKIYILSEDKLKEFNIETSIVRKYLSGENVRRWKINWRKEYVIYPYELKDNNTILIDEGIFRSKYPNAYSYLQKHKHILEKRWGVKAWYELPTVRDINWFQAPKILTPDLSNKSNFCFDNEGYWFSKGLVYGLISNIKINQLYLLGLLNSKVLEFYFKQISPMFSGKYFRNNTKYLERLPIKLHKTETDRKLADEITMLVEEILTHAKVEQKVERFPDIYFDELKNKIDEWDEIAWRAKRGYKSLEPEIKEGVIVLGKDDEIQSEKINSESKLKYVVEALKGKSVSKDEELKIAIPRNDGAITKMLKRLKDDKGRLTSESIADLEDEINKRVYKLYDLDANDIKVIEEFLRKF